jgi:hypothetical protein
LPSSLTRVLPIALVYSTRLPVSVCGTGTQVSSFRGFSRQLGLNHFRPRRVRAHPSDSGCGFAYSHHRPTGLAPGRPSPGWSTLLRSPSLDLGGSGILTGCPSPTTFVLGLGPTNPTRIDLPSETLDIRRTWFSHVLRYSCQHSHFCPLHQSSRSGFDAEQNAPLPIPTRGRNPVASVLGLSPGIFSARDHSTSELLRTL